eukprot:Protomagalhaensia_wolfi_Nauph_80__5960@NODE_79_length_3929_cov_112_472751_g60_i0_p1_GENE_NODE_79_length_3929_cov_112_472751_g60_i0NODE_79_length_3929_cov_112_472751_g60_i0_p1_ORF_typecomplete_len619_score93_32_NODE_79_length_3929_cov_112_472751_g60_i013123168
MTLCLKTQGVLGFTLHKSDDIFVWSPAFSFKLSLWSRMGRHFVCSTETQDSANLGFPLICGAVVEATKLGEFNLIATNNEFLWKRPFEAETEGQPLLTANYSKNGKGVVVLLELPDVSEDVKRPVLTGYALLDTIGDNTAECNEESTEAVAPVKKYTASAIPSILSSKLDKLGANVRTVFSQLEDKYRAYTQAQGAGTSNPIEESDFVKTWSTLLTTSSETTEAINRMKGEATKFRLAVPRNCEPGFLATMFFHMGHALVTYKESQKKLEHQLCILDDDKSEKPWLCSSFNGGDFIFAPCSPTTLQKMVDTTDNRTIRITDFFQAMMDNHAAVCNLPRTSLKAMELPAEESVDAAVERDVPITGGAFRFDQKHEITEYHSVTSSDDESHVFWASDSTETGDPRNVVTFSVPQARDAPVIVKANWYQNPSESGTPGEVHPVWSYIREALQLGGDEESAQYERAQKHLSDTLARDEARQSNADWKDIRGVVKTELNLLQGRSLLSDELSERINESTTVAPVELELEVPADCPSSHAAQVFLHWASVLDGKETIRILDSKRHETSRLVCGSGQYSVVARVTLEEARGLRALEESLEDFQKAFFQLMINNYKSMGRVSNLEV